MGYKKFSIHDLMIDFYRPFFRGLVKIFDFAIIIQFYIPFFRNEVQKFSFCYNN